MSHSSIEHALIVAGPSGAGKSTFLRALADRHLPPEIRAHLPPDAESWRSICSITEHQAWKALIAHDAQSVPGVALHYDMTSTWFRHRPNFNQDPFWQLLDHCGAVTLVTIRPTQERLVAQLRHGHFRAGAGWWTFWKELRVAVPALTVQLIRKLRRPIGNNGPQRWRYPRTLRFLQRLDTRLWKMGMPYLRSLRFYQRRGNIETMLQRWDHTIAARLSSRSVTRLDLMPDPNGEIGGTPHWRVISIGN